jgi:hypothetical protein
MELPTAIAHAIDGTDSAALGSPRESPARTERRVRMIQRLVRAGKYEFESKLAAAIPRLLRDVL